MFLDVEVCDEDEEFSGDFLYCELVLDIYDIVMDFSVGFLYVVFGIVVFYFVKEIL